MVQVWSVCLVWSAVAVGWKYRATRGGDLDSFKNTTHGHKASPPSCVRQLTGPDKTSSAESAASIAKRQVDIAMGLFDYGLACLGTIIVLIAAVLAYPANIILTHVLVESPSSNGDSGQHQSSYALVNKPSSQRGPALLSKNHDDDDDDDSIDGLDYGRYHDKSSPPSASDVEGARGGNDQNEVKTLTLSSAWRNLVSSGKLGLFRALPVTIVHNLVLQALVFVVAGGHGADPSVALAGRFYSDGPAAFAYGCALKLLLVRAILHVALIPLEVTITRQLVTKPGTQRWWNHLSVLFGDTTTIKEMLGCVLPTLLRTTLPAGITLAASTLHIKYLRSAVPESALDILLAFAEVVILLATQLTLVPTLEVLLLQSHIGVISTAAGATELDTYVNLDRRPFPGVLVALMQVLQADKARFANPVHRFWRYAKFSFLIGAGLVAVAITGAMLCLPLYSHTAAASAAAAATATMATLKA